MSLRDFFLLDPDVVFLNHGSYGATPRPVLEVYQGWQRELERQPVAFLLDEYPRQLVEVRRVLGRFVGAEPEDLVLVPNVTFGVNLVAESLEIRPGDEILATDHEYGACNFTWQRLCRRSAATYRQVRLPLPLASTEETLERFWAAVTPRTRLIFVSHLSSSTAQRLPVEGIVARARAAGILTLIDGAHIPGQLPLDLSSLAPDYYVGNCHKWLCAPKGSGFLHVRRGLQPVTEPLIASWGLDEAVPLNLGTPFQDRLQWWGTVDPSAFLSIPAAIQFQAEQRWPEVARACHALLAQGLEGLGKLTGLAPAYRAPSQFAQMAIAPLPPPADAPALKARLYSDYKIEIPVIEWGGNTYLRLSVQGYNTVQDVDRLVEALEELLRLDRL